MSEDERRGEGMGSSPTITCGFWELCYVFFPILKLL